MGVMQTFSCPHETDSLMGKIKMTWVLKCNVRKGKIKRIIEHTAGEPILVQQ